MTKFKTFDEILNVAPYHVRKMILDLKGLRERPDYHPEASAFEHVKIVTQRALDLPDHYEFKNELIAVGLFHDIGKRVCAKPNEKLTEKFGFTPPTSPGHDKFGAEMARGNAEFITNVLGASVDIVEYICAQHMRIASFPNMKKSKKEVYFKETYFPELCVFHAADDMLSNFSEDSMYNVYNKCKSLLNENRTTSEVRLKSQ